MISSKGNPKLSQSPSSPNAQSTNASLPAHINRLQSKKSIKTRNSNIEASFMSQKEKINENKSKIATEFEPSSASYVIKREFDKVSNNESVI